EAMAGRREANSATARKTEGGRYELGDLLSFLFLFWPGDERAVAVLGSISSASAGEVAPAVSCASSWRVLSLSLRSQIRREHDGHPVFQHVHHDGFFVLVRWHGLCAHSLLHSLVCSCSAGFDHDRPGWGKHCLLVSGEGAAAV